MILLHLLIQKQNLQCVLALRRAATLFVQCQLRGWHTGGRTNEEQSDCE